MEPLKYKHGATKTQLLRKENGAHSSIEKRFIPPKDIDIQAQCFIKGP
jgi:hypothetical protein